MFRWIERRNRRLTFHRVAETMDHASEIIGGFPLPRAKDNGEAAIVIRINSEDGSRRLFVTETELANAAAICHAIAETARLNVDPPETE